MKQGKEFILVKKIVACIVMFFVCTLCANASIHSLTGIDVKQSTKDGYNIVLKLAGNTNIKKSVASSDTLTLFLNSTIPSDTMEIIYDNTSSINNVIVQKKNTDNTMIVLEGKNIANANIFTKDISTGNIVPLNTEHSAFVLNKNMFTYSLSVIFILFLSFLFIRPRRKTSTYFKNDLKKHINGNILRTGVYNKERTAPSIAYNSTEKYVSAPKEFVINRYMQEEKMRKAG